MNQINNSNCKKCGGRFGIDVSIEFDESLCIDCYYKKYHERLKKSIV